MSLIKNPNYSFMVYQKIIKTAFQLRNQEEGSKKLLITFINKVKKVNILCIRLREIVLPHFTDHNNRIIQEFIQSRKHAR